MAGGEQGFVQDMTKVGLDLAAHAPCVRPF